MKNNEIIFFDTTLRDTSRLISRLTGITVEPNKAIVGSNASAHESEIHHDASLKARKTFQIMNPNHVGVANTSLLLAKHSARHASSKKIKNLVCKLDKDSLEKLFEKFKDLSDKKKTIPNDDTLVPLITTLNFQLLPKHTCQKTSTYNNIKKTCPIPRNKNHV